MNKAILISIKPGWVEKILNGEKTIEIKKSIPRCDLPTDVYIYCTKGDVNLYKVIRKSYIYFSGAVAEPFDEQIGFSLTKEKLAKKYRDNLEDGFSDIFTNLLNGRIVAKFTLNEVDKLSMLDGYRNHGINWLNDKHIEDDELDILLKKICINFNELEQYLEPGEFEKLDYGIGWLWHIDNLQIFDKPMELNQFEKYYDEPDDKKPCCCGRECKYESYDWCEHQTICSIDYDGENCPFLKVTRPPQSWQYVFVDDEDE